MSEQPVPTVGDIFVESWGYDQTNKDFYQVVGVTPSGKSVKLKAIHSKIVDDDRGGVGADYVVAVKDAFKIPKWNNEGDKYGNTFTKRVKPDNDAGFYINMTSYSGAWLWDGEPTFVTAAGFGH